MSDLLELAGDLSEDEMTVLMQMSGDFGYPAASISADLNYEDPDAGWTPRRVSKIHRSLHAKGYADFGHLMSEDDNLLHGRGYWLCGKGCDIRHCRALAPRTGGVA